MNKKSNSFKNTITVLLTLLLLGIAAGPVSANSGAGDNVFRGQLNQTVSNIILVGDGTSINGTINITFTNPNNGLTFNNTSTVVAVRTGGNAGNTTWGTTFENATLLSIPLTNANSMESVTIVLTGIKVDADSTATLGNQFFSISSSGGTDPSTVFINITIASPSVLPPEVAAWDANNDGKIQKSEAITAVLAYFATPPTISKADAIKVVLAYFS